MVLPSIFLGEVVVVLYLEELRFFNKAGVDICSVPAGYLVPQPPTAPQERNFTPFLESNVNWLIKGVVCKGMLTRVVEKISLF